MKVASLMGVEKTGSPSTSPSDRGLHAQLSRSSQGDAIPQPPFPVAATIQASKISDFPLKSPTGLFDGAASLDAAKRRYHVPIASPDMDLAPYAASSNDGDEESKPKKRPCTDMLDYPRRRATIAVRLRFGRRILDVS